MKFTAAELQASGMSATKIARLQSRQRGGVSGGAGYTYQRRFALVRLSELLHVAPDAVVDVEGLCPVDDVVIAAGLQVLTMEGFRKVLPA